MNYTKRLDRYMPATPALYRAFIHPYWRVVALLLLPVLIFVDWLYALSSFLELIIPTEEDDKDEHSG